MDQKRFNTSPTPEVTIDQVEGNLTLKGWDQDEVVIKGDQEDTIEFDETADTIRLSCQGECIIRLPTGSTVRIGNVHGEARVKLLEEALTIDMVEGNLILSHLARVTVTQVSGELVAKHLSGDLYVEQVEGNATLRDIQGGVHLGQVSGNLDLRGADGEIIADAQGNARIRLGSLEGGEYRISADGNLDFRIRSQIDAQVSLSSNAGQIRVSTPEGRTLVREPEHNLTFGGGQIPMTLSAEGNLTFVAQDDSVGDFEQVDVDFDEDMAGFSQEFSEQLAEQIERQVETQMQALSRQLEEQMANLSSVAGRAGMSAERMEQIMQRARETSERATARAQEKMRRAQERLERKLEVAQRKADARARSAERRRGQSWGYPGPTPPAGPASEPVGDEERMMILRMLEEKKISIEEAERLLAALEGKDE